MSIEMKHGHPCSQLKSARPVAIAIHPNIENSYAFLMQKRGFQGVWLVNTFEDCSIRSTLNGVADIGFPDASILDIQWHPVKSTLLMSVDDKDGSTNYRYDFDKDKAYVILDTGSQLMKLLTLKMVH